MRHMHMAAVAALLSATVAGAYPIPMEIDVADARTQTRLYVGRGEVVDLEIALTYDGEAYDIGGAGIALYTRTNGQASASAWLSPGSATNNVATVRLDVDRKMPSAQGTWTLVATNAAGVLARVGGPYYVRGTALPSAIELPVDVLGPYATTNYVAAYVASHQPPPSVTTNDVRRLAVAEILAETNRVVRTDAQGDITISGDIVAGNISGAGTVSADMIRSLADINATGAITAGGAIIATAVSDSTGDLRAAINDKADTSSLAAVATSGSYNDLTNRLTAGANITISADNVISASGGTPRTDVTTTGQIRYATGLLTVTIPANGAMTAVTTDWPDGDAVMCRLTAAGAYTVGQHLNMVGYGTWPTNSATIVWWREGAELWANVIKGN